MKTLVKPLKIEEQYQSIESFCSSRDRCSTCSGEGSNNGLPEADDDILF